MKSEEQSDLLRRMAQASDEIYRNTGRSRANWLRVEVGSPVHQAIERGEFPGIEPGSGVPCFDDGSWLEYTKPAQ